METTLERLEALVSSTHVRKHRNTTFKLLSVTLVCQSRTRSGLRFEVLSERVCSSIRGVWRGRGRLPCTTLIFPLEKSVCIYSAQSSSFGVEIVESTWQTWVADKREGAYRGGKRGKKVVRDWRNTFYSRVCVRKLEIRWENWFQMAVICWEVCKWGQPKRYCTCTYHFIKISFISFYYFKI